MAGVSPGSIFRSPTLLLLLVIVVGSVSMMAAGFGTPPPATDTNESEAPYGALDGGGGGDGGDGGDGDGTEAVPLSLSLNESVIRPGGTVLATVRAEGGPVADALVSVRGETVRTDEAGRAVLTLASGGEASVRATRPSDERNYRPASATVTVERYVVPLELSANASDATAGDAVAFTVRAGNDTVPARVTVDGESHRTGRDGVAVVTVDRAGAFTARATKAMNATTRYRPAETGLAVERRTVGLSATVGDDDVVAGERVPVTVRRSDTDAPVAGANVTLDGVRYRTDGEGVARVPVERARSATLVATAPRTPAVEFTEARAVVDVRRRSVPLSLSVSPAVAESGTNVTVAVERADTGEPVAATVTVDGRAHETGPDGLANVTLAGYGRQTARATKARTPAERYVPAAVGVTALAPDLVVGNLSAPANATRGESLRVAGTVTNVGNAAGSATLALRLDDRTIATRTVTLSPGATERVRVDATVPPDVLPGETTVALVETDPVVGDPDGANATLTVRGAAIAVGDVSAPTSASAGETIDVTGTVRNVGTDAGEATVAYRIDGATLAETRVSLAPGGIERVRFSVTVPDDLDAGAHEQAVTTADDAATLALTIEDGDAGAATTTAASVDGGPSAQRGSGAVAANIAKRVLLGV